MFNIDEMTVAPVSNSDERFGEAAGLGRELRCEFDVQRRFQYWPELLNGTEPSRDAHVGCRPFLQHFIVGSGNPQRQIRYNAVYDRDSERRYKRSSRHPGASGDADS